MKRIMVTLKGRAVSCMLFLLLFTASCTLNFGKEVYGEGKVVSVTVSVFADSIDNPGVQLVDVRTPDEYAAGHIEGSVNIDVLTGHFGETAATMLDKAYTVAVYCRSGNRSKNAAQVLSMMGYNVVELNGGYNEWVNIMTKSSD
jgi:rhodanese-related sulfurtransferase